MPLSRLCCEACAPESRRPQESTVVSGQTYIGGGGMRGQTQYGKGSGQRPTDSKKYADNYDAIFGKDKQKPKDKEKEVKK